RVVEAKTRRQYTLTRLRSAKCSYDGKWIAYLTTPAKTTSKKTQPAKTTKPKKTAPKKTGKTPVKKTAVKAKVTSSLVILELATGRKMTIERVRSFAMPTKAANWIAYHFEKDPPLKIEKPGKSIVHEVETIKKRPKRGKGKDRDQRRRTRRRSQPSTRPTTAATLALRNLSTGMEIRYPHVTQFKFAENGRRLAWTAAGRTTRQSGVFVLSTVNFETRQIASGRKQYRNLTFDKSGNHLAFFVSASSSKTSEKSLYHWNANDRTATVAAAAGKNGFAKDRRIASSSPCSFSQDGSRIFFSTVKRTAKKRKSAKKKSASKKTATSTAKPVKLDIWHWKDPYLQPMQLAQARRERSRSYAAVVHLKSKRTVQLATESVPNVSVGDRGNSNIAVGVSNLPYRMKISWDWPAYLDAYLIDVTTGKRRRVLTGLQSRCSLSPQGKYLYWWDVRQRAWMAMDVTTRKAVNLTKDIFHPLFDELHDRPYPPAAYGSAGWLKDDAALLVYDKHDIWSVDPTGKVPPKCLTEEYGRKHNLRFRRVRLNREERSIEPKSIQLLSAFHLQSKASGFYRDRFDTTQPPVKLVMKDERMSLLTKAKSSNDILLTRSTFQRFPDLWQSTIGFRSLRRISDANPQQQEYAWGKSELVQWKSKDGLPLQGLLIKPQGFDPKKKYPMLVYFYERMSDRLHRYTTPAPVRASINLSFYVSRGYLIFVPDIAYKIGSPGESALNCIVPGVESVIKKGFVNEKKIGVQGHSWGGYQVAYLVTRTNIFAAAESGAPVSNMTSAYGGIRWGTGMSRQFQYEKSQSRLGGSLWEVPNRYFENSPLFFADKVLTPLLMLHNDHDGAVPWYQGIEYFMALRRLNKPVWLLNYNGEDHGLGKYQNRRDYAQRMSQFFDHYLRGAPAPVWMDQGVPALRKGRTLGLEIMGEAE
ncbi:MAG: S9 family peptidase, partial [Planctomycetes bacterium]|nr:S9 family peptidase [Planctomycetota bacterium]